MPNTGDHLHFAWHAEEYIHSQVVTLLNLNHCDLYLSLVHLCHSCRCKISAAIQFQMSIFSQLWKVTLALTALKYFCINYRDQRVFFKFEITRNALVLSALFEYLCYESTAIVILYASAAKRAKALCSRVVRPSGCPVVRRSVRPSVRPVYAASFGYYANMVQQIEFIICTNVQPLRQKFFTKGEGQSQGQRF